MKISLCVIRTARTVETPLTSTGSEYLRRCSLHFETEARNFKSEDALLQFVAVQKKNGSATLWIADTSGQPMTSMDFAQRISQARDSGRRQLLLAVGPADGWSDAARARADLRLSLGPMTLPHELAALVLAEQIYRASTILQGHPYHLGH